MDSGRKQLQINLVILHLGLRLFNIYRFTGFEVKEKAPFNGRQKESLVKHVASEDVPGQIISILGHKGPLTNVASHAP